MERALVGGFTAVLAHIERNSGLQLLELEEQQQALLEACHPAPSEGRVEGTGTRSETALILDCRSQTPDAVPPQESRDGAKRGEASTGSGVRGDGDEELDGHAQQLLLGFFHHLFLRSFDAQHVTRSGHASAACLLRGGDTTFPQCRSDCGAQRPTVLRWRWLSRLSLTHTSFRQRAQPARHLSAFIYA